MFDKGGVVYIMTNASYGVLYVGVTSDLWTRIYRHKVGLYKNSFTSRYHLNRLVYYKFFLTIDEAILEEKRIKGGNRAHKIKLILAMNPNWEDLCETNNL